ncbi:hypothetical protein DMH88_05870 [Escherichia coli]|nr:hypothetical protein [Escherichia coli]
MDGNNRRSICRFCFIHDCAEGNSYPPLNAPMAKPCWRVGCSNSFIETNMLNLQFQRVVRPAGALLHWHKGHDRK